MPDKQQPNPDERQIPPPAIDPQVLAMYGMQQEDEIDLLMYWRAIWQRRILILAVSLGVGVLVAIYVYHLPDIYKAEVLLTPVSDEGSSRASGGLSGLASLAGISLGGGGDVDQNLAILQSRGFIWHFIKDEDLMPILFESAWDEKTGKWKEADPKKQPTLWDAYRVFSGMMHVVRNDKSGLVTVEIEGKDPQLDSKWANALIDRLNEFLRQRAIAESNTNLEYLTRELSHTQVDDVRKALFQLISQEQKKAMLANGRHQYAFQVLDAASPPDKKFKPKRLLIVLLALLGASLVMMGGVCVRESINKGVDGSHAS